MHSKSFFLKLNHKIQPFNKSIKVDSDKSISIRSFLIGSICQNISFAKNVLESEDVISTISALRKLGVKIQKVEPRSYKIYGKGLGSLFAKKNLTLNFGNSGTLARLLIGILSTTPDIEINVRGDHSLNKRSMKKLIKIMSEFGAEFLPKNKFNFPKEHKNYLIPQVLTNVNHDMDFMTEETFGPCVGIMKVKDENEAIKLMNDSPYGLTASIWTKDLEIAEKVGDQVQTGTFYMNRCDYLDPALSWTGVKETGKGCSLSEIAYEKLTAPKSFHLRKEQ